jgi:hypothetical protein
MCVTNAVLKESQDWEWRFHLMLCTYCYRDFAHYLPNIRTSRLGLSRCCCAKWPSQIREAMIYLSDFDLRDHRYIEVQSLRSFVLDLNLAVSDTDRARIGGLIDKCDHTTVFSDATQDEV